MSAGVGEQRGEEATHGRLPDRCRGGAADAQDRHPHAVTQDQLWTGEGGRRRKVKLGR